jgi:hypothetical protein
MSRKLIIFGCTLCLVCGVIPAKAANLITNGGFDTDFTGWWTYVPVPADQSITIDTVNFYSGTGSAKMNCLNSSDSWQELGQDFAAAASTTYNLSFEYSAEQWAQGGVNIKYMDASWGYLGYQWFSLLNTPNPAGWQIYSGSFTTVAGTAHAEVKFTEGGYGAMNIDDVSVTPEPATMVLLGIGGLVALRRKHA